MTSDNINHQQHKMAHCQRSTMPIYAGRQWHGVVLHSLPRLATRL